MKFFPMLLFLNKSPERELNPLPGSLSLYLSGSAFLVSFTDPHKQFFNVKSVFKFLNHRFSV